MITNGDITIIVGSSIVLFILFMIARYYGNWNMLIYGPLIVLIPLTMFGSGGNSGAMGPAFQAALVLFFIYPIYYVITYIIKDYSNKNPPANNTRYNNNRSNNTRTAKYLN
jgi:hypothetical protein